METDRPRHSVPIDIPGWPLASVELISGTPIVTLTEVAADATEAQSGPMRIIVCPHCRKSTILISRRDLYRKCRSIPSCGCRKGYGKNPDCSRTKKPK